MSGILQGSVLGPIRFVIFINDMLDVVTSMCYMPDDTKVFIRISSKENVASLQGDLDNLSDWSEKWQLSFNVGICRSLQNKWRRTRA